MTSKIYISRLSAKTSDQDVYNHFAKVGRVLSVAISKGIDGKTNADNGYVVMANDAEMNAAIVKLNNSSLNGNKIRVIKAHFIDQDGWRPPRIYKIRRR